MDNLSERIKEQIGKGSNIRIRTIYEEGFDFNEHFRAKRSKILQFKGEPSTGLLGITAGRNEWFVLFEPNDKERAEHCGNIRLDYDVIKRVLTQYAPENRLFRYWGFEFHNLSSDTVNVIEHGSDEELKEMGFESRPRAILPYFKFFIELEDSGGITCYVAKHKIKQDSKREKRKWERISFNMKKRKKLKKEMVF